MATGVHLCPFRTEKLSPSALMVLRHYRRGRVSRHQNLSFNGSFLGAIFVKKG